MNTKSDKASVADERRRFFRINDTIGLNYRISHRDENTTAEPGVTPSKPHRPVDLKNLLAANDTRFNKVLISLQKRDPLVFEALQLLNQKLSLITSYLEVERGRVDDVEFLVKHVNISACGVAFIADEDIPVQSYLAMELLLGGEISPLQVRGTVIACNEKHKGQFYVRVDFDEMDSADQETLIQYMLKRQGEQLREMLSKRKPGHMPLIN